MPRRAPPAPEARRRPARPAAPPSRRRAPWRAPGSSLASRRGSSTRCRSCRWSVCVCVCVYERVRERKRDEKVREKGPSEREQKRAKKKLQKNSPCSTRGAWRRRRRPRPAAPSWPWLRPPGPRRPRRGARRWPGGVLRRGRSVMMMMMMMMMMMKMRERERGKKGWRRSKEVGELGNEEILDGHRIDFSFVLLLPFASLRTRRAAAGASGGAQGAGAVC